MVQKLFGRSLHRLRVGEIGLGGFFLARGIQEFVVGLLDSVNYVAVCVIEREVRCQELGFRRVDSAGPRAKIKNRVIQIQRDLKIAESLTEEAVRQVSLGTVNPCECRSCYCGIEFAARDTPSGGLRAGALPRHSRLWIVRFREID